MCWVGAYRQGLSPDEQGQSALTRGAPGPQGESERFRVSLVASTEVAVGLPAARRRLGRRAHLTRTGSSLLALMVSAGALTAPSATGSMAPSPSEVNSSASALVLKSCSRAGEPARCGTVMVPENRLTGRGREIPVRVVVIPATDSKPAPDPIVYFAGGPGTSAVDVISQELPLLELNTSRDVVFIEQRGTGKSNVSCPPFPGPSLANKSAIRASVKSCLAHLTADPRFYTTAMFVDDVAEVLSDLHYGKVDLVGGSYGATAAQVFLLRYPRRVRTMTLLGGSLLSVPLFERFPANSQTALDRVFAECRASAACHRAFPNPARDWTKLLASIRRSPWVLPATQSPTHEKLVLDSAWLASSMHQLLFDATTQVDIPLVVHLLASAKNPIPVLVALTKALPPAPSSSAGNQLVAWETRCNEAWARDDPSKLVGKKTFEYAADLADARWRQYVCSLLPKSKAAVGIEPLKRSPVPVLAFNGIEDPQDPPANMAGAKALWPNSLVLAVPNQGHNIDFSSWVQCAMQLTERFLETARTAQLAASCLSRLPSPTFPLNVDALSGG